MPNAECRMPDAEKVTDPSLAVSVSIPDLSDLSDIGFLISGMWAGGWAGTFALS
jgi:hypothetical protein